MGSLSTTKLFILIVIAFVSLLVFVIGFNPFSFGDAYFRPRSNPPASSSNPEFIVLPDDAQPTEVNIDR